nr:hypothetical protein [Methylorubrum thiocyanatum]
MKIKSTSAAFLFVMLLPGCGTVVPDLTEFPHDTSQAGAQNMIQAVVRSVRCQLQDAITRVVSRDLRRASEIPGGRVYSAFLDNWGAEVAFTFTIVEKTTISPSALLKPPPATDFVFNAALGLSGSAEATRIEKMNIFYTVRDLFRPNGPRCDASGEQRNGSLLVQNDLKLSDLLYGRILATVLGNADDPEPGRKNVLSHQVSFQTIASASATPTWTLVRATVNPNGPFFSTSRDKTHDLLITFGPVDRAAGGKSLIPIAEQFHFTSQITSGISNGFRSAVSQ